MDDDCTIIYDVTYLYPSERDVIVKKLELIKDKFYNKLDIKYSMVSEDNWVGVKNNVDLTTGVKLFKMFKTISFNLENNEANCMDKYSRNLPVTQLYLEFKNVG